MNVHRKPTQVEWFAAMLVAAAPAVVAWFLVPGVRDHFEAMGADVPRFSALLMAHPWLPALWSPVAMVVMLAGTQRPMRIVKFGSAFLMVAIIASVYVPIFAMATAP